MKRIAIPLVIGLVIGLGGSTAAVMFLGGEEASLTDSLADAMGEEHADSVQPETGEHADSAAHVAEGSVDHAESLELAADTAAHPAAVGGSHDAAGAQPAASTAMTPGGSAAPAMSTAALAGLFATMQAREAARVLEHMEDMEVQTILGQLGNREAAAILSNLKPERAAVISGAILRGERSLQ